MPIEIGVKSLRNDEFKEQSNEDGLRVNLDLIEEHRTKAQLRVAAY